MAETYCEIYQQGPSNKQQNLVDNFMINDLSFADVAISTNKGLMKLDSNIYADETYRMISSRTTQLDTRILLKCFLESLRVI